MKKVFVLGVFFLMVGSLSAQQFTEQPEFWRTEMYRARGLDTIMFERHAAVTVPAISADSMLIYHEPLPDNTMPKTSIDLGTITIQAGSSDEVVEILEERAREMGADWIVGFNEPRRKRMGDKFIYRSQARFFRVLDPNLVDGESIKTIFVSDERITDLAAAYSWVSRNIVEHGSGDE